MRGDFTRDTFDRANHFSRVLMQQGRVQVDADWNEQASILLHYLRTLAKDVLGPHAGPKGDELGFGIATKELADAELKKILDRFGLDDERRKEVEKAIKDGDAVIGPGRYYVDGILVENERAVLFSEQLGLGYDSPSWEEARENLDEIPCLLYLDVWERHVTTIELDWIREAALGGPDTCSRAQVAWRVRALIKNADDATFDAGAIDRLLPLGTGTLRAQARVDKDLADELCVISPESRYRGPENQLYRVEVHRAKTAAGNDEAPATFKWSRENGSVVFPVCSFSDKRATLEHLGLDAVLGLKRGDWVEWIDDDITASERAGPLARIADVDGDELSVTLEWSDEDEDDWLPRNAGEEDLRARHALLRRWDHRGDPKQFGGALLIEEDGDGFELEDGVRIWFGKGTGKKARYYRSGDYWLIPARVATGDVEWPDQRKSDGTVAKDEHGKSVKAFVPAHGPRHHFAPLELFMADKAPEDCRRQIDSLKP